MRTLALAAALCSAAASSAFAQADWELHMTLGQSMIVGSEADRLTDAPAVSLSAINRLGGLWSAGLELGMTLGNTIKGRFSQEQLGDVDVPADGVKDSLPFKSSTKLRFLWLTPVLRLGLPDEFADKSWRPYAMFGAGFYNEHNAGGTAQLYGYTSHGTDAANAHLTAAIPSSGKSNFFGINTGVGLVARLASRLEMAADVRFHYIFTDLGSAQFLLPSARFIFLF